MEYAPELQRLPGYQPRGEAWDPGRLDLLELLASAHHVQTYPIYQGSNHTFLVVLEADEAGRSLSVYKPARGEYPLYDFPAGTLYRREIAAWLLDRLLGWAVVPPIVETRGQYGVGSLQIFIESPNEAEINIDQLRPMAVLDTLLNNADRKADHCLPSLDGKLWGIDHGLTFHAQPKMRTVLWHFAGSALTEQERADMQRVYRSLCDQDGEGARQLRRMIAPVEWRALLGRFERMLEIGRLPNPRYKPVPYRW